MLGGGDLEGSGDFFCEGVASLSAAGPRDISFVKDDSYFDEARATRAGALLVPSPIDDCGAEQLVVPNPLMDPEPLPAGHPLWSMPNVVLTPHLAGVSDVNMLLYAGLAAENLRRYARGDGVANVVNLRRGY